MVALGPFIRDLRKQRNLTLKELGKCAGISFTQISKIERNLHTPSIDTIEKISEALKYNTNELIKLAGHKANYVKFYSNIDNMTRYNILIKFNSTCQICGAKAPYTEIDVSPIKSEEFGGDINALENLIALCSNCFEARNQQIKRQGIDNDYLVKKFEN